MTTYRSKATGNWSATTTWEDVTNPGVDAGPPGTGDRATIVSGHTVTVDVPSIIGHTPAAISGALTGTLNSGTQITAITGTGTLFTTELAVGDILSTTAGGSYSIVTAIASDTALTVNHAGDVTVVAPVKREAGLVVRGTLVINSTLTLRAHLAMLGPVTINGGGILQADSATVLYHVFLGDATGILTGNGTSYASMATITSTTAGMLSLLKEVSNVSSDVRSFDLSYTTVSNLGAAAVDSMNVGVKTSGNTFNVDHSTFRNCGRILISAFLSSAHFVWDSNLITQSVDPTTAFDWTGTGASTATRTWTNNVCDPRIFTRFIGGWGNFTFTNNLFGPVNVSGAGGGSGTMVWSGNMVNNRTDTAGTNRFGATVAATYAETYMIADTDGTNPHFTGATSSAVFDGWVVEYTGDDFTGEFLLSNANATNVVLKNSLFLPNSGGGQVGAIINQLNQTSSTGTVSGYHNTAMVSALEGGFFYGETGNKGYPNNFVLSADNLMWDTSVRAGQYLGKKDLTDPVKTGTATSATATTLTHTGASLSGLNGWTIYITGGTDAGDVRTVISSTSTVVTVAGWTVTPDATSTYKIVPIDIYTSVHHNALYNLATGNVYDSAGLNPVARMGYNYVYTSNVAAFGANDVVGQNPQFVDTTRNFATWASAAWGLGYSGSSVDSSSVAKGTWTTSTAYAVGDVVAYTKASFYGSAVILYRCTVAHTSGATTEPGVFGQPWRDKWEFYSAYLLQRTILNMPGANASATMANLFSLVRAGWRPQNSALFAASDVVSPSNGWIGALEGSSGSGEVRQWRGHTGRFFHHSTGA